MVAQKSREIEDLIQNEDIVRYIKSLRISWLGHVNEMDDSIMRKNIYNRVFFGPPKKRKA